jgi:hypothetical protein
MNVRRALTTGLLVLAAASVAAVPVAANAASAPVTNRGEGWTQQGTYLAPEECVQAGREGAVEGQWADFECVTNDAGSWDLWVTAAE